MVKYAALNKVNIQKYIHIIVSYKLKGKMKVPCDKIETSIADNTKDCHREK